MAYMRAYQALGDPGGLSIMRQMKNLGMKKIKGRGLRNFARSARGAVRMASPIVGFIPGAGMPYRIASQLMGDPGLGSLLGRLGRGAASVFGRAAGSPVGRAVGAMLAGGGALGALGGVAAGVAIPAAVGMVGRALSGGGRRTSRRMDVGNVKALRRSMRRVEGFAKLAKSTISFTKQTRMKTRGRKR